MPEFLLCIAYCVLVPSVLLGPCVVIWVINADPLQAAPLTFAVRLAVRPARVPSTTPVHQALCCARNMLCCPDNASVSSVELLMGDAGRDLQHEIIQLRYVKPYVQVRQRPAEL